MVGWHHRCNEHEPEQTLGVGDGQGSLVYCSPWGHEKLGMTGRLNNYSSTLFLFLHLRFLVTFRHSLKQKFLI